MSLYSFWARKRYAEEVKKNAEELEKHNMLKLSEWLETKKNLEPTIFVDQDNTLLYLSDVMTMSRLGSWANNNATFADIMGNNVGILPRPHAKNFLSECKKIGTVYILTAGTTSFQEKVLESVGMLSMVKDVYGRDRYHEVPKGGHNILIDNLPHTHFNSDSKLAVMGGGMFLKVPDWNGDNKDDNALLETLVKVKKAYQSVA